MRVSHERTAPVTLEGAVDRLKAFIAERRSSKEPCGDMECFERELHEALAAAAKAADRPRTAAGKAKVAVVRASRETAAARKRAKAGGDAEPHAERAADHEAGEVVAQAGQQRREPDPRRQLAQECLRQHARWRQH